MKNFKHFRKERLELFFLVLILFFTVSCSSGRAQTKKNTKSYNFANKQSTTFGYKGNSVAREADKIEARAEAEYGQVLKNENQYAYNKPSAGARGDHNRLDSSYNYQNNTPKNNYRNNNEETSDSYKMKKYFQTGVASWYGREFNGRETASGEKFNMYQLTAAHKTLSFGTIIKVRNFDNGKIVKVRINDRGPYYGDRILDLSYAAAKELDMISSGSAFVGVYVVGKESDSNSASFRGRNKYESARPVAYQSMSSKTNRVEAGLNKPLTVEEGIISLQVGAFYSRGNADKMKTKIENLLENKVVIISEENLFKVRVKGILNKEEEEKFKKMLQEENISSFAIEE